MLIGGDSPGELLVIKDIMANSPAEQDGILERDDVLVRVNDQIILMCPHQDVVQLIKSVQMGSVVEIEVPWIGLDIIIIVTTVNLDR